MEKIEPLRTDKDFACEVQRNPAMLIYTIGRLVVAYNGLIDWGNDFNNAVDKINEKIDTMNIMCPPLQPKIIFDYNKNDLINKLSKDCAELKSEIAAKDAEIERLKNLIGYVYNNREFK